MHTFYGPRSRGDNLFGSVCLPQGGWAFAVDHTFNFLFWEVSQTGAALNLGYIDRKTTL